MSIFICMFVNRYILTFELVFDDNVKIFEVDPLTCLVSFW